MKRLLLLFLLALPVFGQHAYWRLNVTQGSDSAISIAEWQSFDGGSSLISTSGGTASASSTVAGSAADAFDGSSATFWASNGCANPCTEWLQYHFASAVSPVSFTLQTRTSLGYQVPFDLAVQYSDTGSSWTTLYSYYGIPWSGASSATVTLDSAHAAPASIGISWRILVTSDAAGQDTSLSELKLYDKGSSQYTTTPWAYLSSSTLNAFPAGLAFDGSIGTAWASNAVPSGGTPQWIGYRFASSVSLATFSITARNDCCTDQSPVAFTLQKSTDEITWTTVGTYTAATWTTNGQVQTFVGPSLIRHRVNTE